MSDHSGAGFLRVLLEYKLHPRKLEAAATKLEGKGGERNRCVAVSCTVPCLIESVALD
jgi:hypothetical protein